MSIIQDVLRRKILHSTVLHMLVLSVCMCARQRVEYPIQIGVLVDFEASGAGGSLLFEFGAESRYQAAQQIIQEARDTTVQVTEMYGVALDVIKTALLPAGRAVRNYEVEDFYRAVARHWSATRPMSSLGTKIAIKVVFYADKIVVASDRPISEGTQVFVQRAIAAVYAAYQDRKYNIPSDTTLQFGFQV